MTAFHPPCTLQHWQGLRGVSEQLLEELGFNLQPFTDSHLCCGSAGTYSVTQPELSKALRNRKLDALHAAQPNAIVSSNRSEEHTSELQSLMRISYAVFCLKKKRHNFK